ncbi:ribose-5-phosphate isomerase RpiA [Methylocella silvestris]|uniref:Ribose-5-phosphate isomerase A n=1 Tax=Methylocella silvestris TaxID=199596 RepID=A0A2J7TKL8_METSI|nr:ribose-5-phosphate isomerase RpiA [Methylocella silvestris]PNG27298.1 ribose 5-phosphate isomerase A [Methylocella silvestris]
MTALSPDEAKRAAAAEAIKLVRPGMKLGLGTGSTARHFVDLLGGLVAAGLDVLCVPTSEETRAQAAALGVALTTIDAEPELDLTVDGADEFDDALRLVKGGGGALLREKIVATASKRMVVIADASKHVELMGKFPLPVEVTRFGLEATRRLIRARAAAAGCAGDIVLRDKGPGQPFITDNGNFILDCHFGALPRPEQLAQDLSAIPGVVEHGLFIGLAKAVICAGPGGIEIFGRVEAPPPP